MCFAGTIVGVTLALCEVGRFLFSENLATFFDYTVSCDDTGDTCTTQVVFSCIITLVLLFLANFVLWSLIRKELYSTRFYQLLCCIDPSDNWNEIYAENRNSSDFKDRINPTQSQNRWTQEYTS